MKITPFAGKRKTQAESKCCLLLPESRETFRLRQSQLQHASPAAGRLPAITPSTGPTAQRGHGAGKDKDTGNVPPPLPRTSAHPSICQLPRRPQPSSLLRGTVPRCALSTVPARLPASRHSGHIAPPAPRSPPGLFPWGPGPAPPPPPSPHRWSARCSPLAPLGPTETRVGQESGSHVSVGSAVWPSYHRGSAVAACGLRRDLAPRTPKAHARGEAAQENLQSPPCLHLGLRGQWGLFVLVLS